MKQIINKRSKKRRKGEKTDFAKRTIIGGDILATDFFPPSDEAALSSSWFWFCSISITVTPASSR